MANANETSPAEMEKQPQRFRVLLVERHFYHLDVLARSQNDAAGIAIASSELWVDDDDGDSDVSLILPIAFDDGNFWPPDDACRRCGQTLTPDEDRNALVCDKCAYHFQRNKAA